MSKVNTDDPIKVNTIGIRNDEAATVAVATAVEDPDIAKYPTGTAYTFDAGLTNNVVNLGILLIIITFIVIVTQTHCLSYSY